LFTSEWTVSKKFDFIRRYTRRSYRARVCLLLLWTSFHAVLS